MKTHKCLQWCLINNQKVMIITAFHLCSNLIKWYDVSSSTLTEVVVLVAMPTLVEMGLVTIIFLVHGLS